MDYKKHIGDGKTPNKYWVFQYDQKYRYGEDNTIELIKEDTGTENSFLGEFNSFENALICVDDKAYLPNVVIEDRISGQVFEQICIVCKECRREEHITHKDINFTKEILKERNIEFK